MTVEDTTADAVHFAIVDQQDAAQLSGRLASLRWVLHDLDGIWLLAVELEPADDLAALLRDVEAWIADRGLPELRFSLDGRWYVMRATRVAATSPV